MARRRGIVLGLGSTELVLLTLTMVTSVLTVVPGRATLLQGGIHIAILGAFLFLAASPRRRGPASRPANASRGWR